MLFHQIHRAKLLTDFGTSFASSWLLWEKHWVSAALVAFLPSMALSAMLVKFADLERLQHTWFGDYVARQMTSRVVWQRIAGQVLAWAGAVAHVSWLIPFGYFVIVLAWLDGLWTDRSRAA
jgi:hypothetical protein